MAFESDAVTRLSNHLNLPADNPQIERLTPDASTREFFRIPWSGSTAIACLYPEPIDETLPQLDVTKLFLEARLPVAKIFATSFDIGLVIHEDFGDVILRDALEHAPDSNSLIDDAIGLIGRIQAATPLAHEMDSIASRLKFDVEKLTWELDFFRRHYFTSLLSEPLSGAEEERLGEEFYSVSEQLEARATTLTHRDFHAANLMLKDGRLRIIDHQDARIGAATYDLVSLLLDRIESIPADSFLASKKKLLQRVRAEAGLGPIEDIDREFDLVAIQRCLKAIGTFSNQAANAGKRDYLRYVPTMFKAVSLACGRLQAFPLIRQIAGRESIRRL